MLTIDQCNSVISRNIVQAVNVVGYQPWDVAKYVLSLENPFLMPTGEDIKTITSIIENAGGVQNLLNKVEVN